MAFHAELLTAARQLLMRSGGQRGRLPTARVRRSASTAYYALFHFLSEQCGSLLVGTENDLVARRRILQRTLTHSGFKLSLKKVRAANVAEDVREFLRSTGDVGTLVQVPAFIQQIANTFLEAQDLRHQADYDMSTGFAVVDARNLIEDVALAIDTWNAATAVADRRFKKALCLLMLLRGRLRTDD